MGAVRYLCITILLVSLAVSALGAAYAANDRVAACSNLGRLGSDALTCLCESGIAGAACEAGQLTCGSEFKSVSSEKAEHYPKLDVSHHTINFTENILTLSVAGPLVANRSYSDIKFVGSDDTRCALGSTGSFWTLSADEETCQDRLALEMHWSNHAACKFALMHGSDVPEDVWEFRATILVTYVDRLPAIGEEDAIAIVNRRTSASFEIFVQFQKTIVVNITEVVVYSDATLTLYLTQFLYNPDTMQVFVELITRTDWPNQIKFDEDNLPSLNFLPEHLELAAQPDPDVPIVNIVNQMCGYDEANPSPCRQVITFYVQVKEEFRAEFGCSAFNGRYELNMTMAACRTAGSIDNEACPWKYKYPNFTIVDHFVCGNISVQPTIKADLTAYADEARTIPATNFFLGAIGYFAINVKDNANALNLTIINLYVTPDATEEEANPADIYFIQNKVVVSEYLGKSNPNYDSNTISSIVDLKLSTDDHGDLVSQSMPNGDLVYTPNFQFQYDGFVFRPAVGTTRGYTVHILAKITYRGNEDYPNGKRELSSRVVDFMWKPSGADLRGSVDTSVSSGVAAEETSVAGSSKSLLTAILPVAGVALVVVAVAIIAAVVIVKKKKTQAYTPFSN